MAIKVHLSVTRPVPFARDAFITKSLCNRNRTLADGMNLTGAQGDVTCKFCLSLMAAKDFATRYRASLEQRVS